MRYPRFIPPRSNPTASETQSRLTALEQMLADQQRRITEQEQEITRQHARLAEQADTISRLRQNLESDTDLRSDLRQGQAPADLLSPSLDDSADGQRVHATSRRSLLRLGGMGAAAGVVVAASNWYSSGSVAHAAGGSGDGTAIVQGSANVNTSQTGTILNPAASTGPTTLLTADNSTSTSTDSTATAGVKAVGPIETNGVIGVGNGAGGYGIWGQSDAGFGVVGESGTGIDLGAFGTGRLQQLLQSGAGAPTSGSHAAGEQIRDANGELWICLAAGAPGTWARMPHTQTGFKGGVLNFLSVPIRVIDTRSGQNPAAPLPTTKAPLASGQTYTFQITGTSVGGSSVPAGAVGIYANVTVVFPTNGGNLIFYPADQAQPQSSTINYSQGAVVGNFSVIGLSASGSIKVFVNGPANTDVVVDIAGFII